MNTILKDFLKTFFLLLITSILAYAARRIGEATDIIVVVYVLTVVLVSRMTNGYFWGILASIFGVLATNFIFAFPYFAFNLTLSGYPVTFCAMLATSIITSYLTSNYKKQKEAAEKMAVELQKSYEEQHLAEVKAEKEKLKSNLLRVISHDLRTPLTGIKGASSAMLESWEVLSDETKKKLLEDIVDESQWLIRMVENLLSVTHISEETMKVNKVPQVAEEIIANAVSHFHNADPDISISVNVPDELIIVPMDATLIEQVLLNLFDNAAKHAGDSTKLSVRLFSDDENNAVFEVKDDGKGIPEEDIKYLFEYGETKNSNVPADSQRSFGIGLPTCKTIIQAHSGEIWVESKVGEGSCFSFTLPMEDNENNEAVENDENTNDEQ